MQLQDDIAAPTIHFAQPNDAAYPWKQCPICLTLSVGAVCCNDGTSLPVEHVATLLREEDAVIDVVLSSPHHPRTRFIVRTSRYCQ